MLCGIVVASGVALATAAVNRAEVTPYPMVPQRAPRTEISFGGLPSSLVDALAVPVEMSIPRGASLSGLLQNAGLERSEAWQASVAVKEHLDARSLRAGASFTAFVDGQDRVQRILFPQGERGQVTLARYGRDWRSQFDAYERRVEVDVVRGTLQTSLESAMTEAGASPTLAYHLADVLQWDLDFTRDLRVGDSFKIAFESIYVEGRFVRIGQVLAASYVNRDRPIEAFRFEDLGYYDAEGRPLRKQFLRSPLKFSRVTSRFSHRRFHPILKIHRPHYGVDYGAPVGTPVRVTANGTIVSAGWSKGGGNVVKVRHPNGYVTSYLHLSKFASVAKRGRRVQQGEVVGYVGSTGLSTGPHLDYRVQQGGKYMDPLSLKSEPAPPLADAEMERYGDELMRLRDLLDSAPSAGRSAGRPAERNVDAAVIAG
ncbi:MAG: peptidoglycan DD-metalloendopeptidase family protein [Acidobacteriota bacterium]